MASFVGSQHLIIFLMRTAFYLTNTQCNIYICCQPILDFWVKTSASCSIKKPPFKYGMLLDVSCTSCIGSQILYHCATWEALKMKVLVTQSRPTLCDPRDCSPPDSSVHGILQARILEWVAIPLSKGSSCSRDWTHVSCIASKFFTIWATREALLDASNIYLLVSCIDMP